MHCADLFYACDGVLGKPSCCKRQAPSVTVLVRLPLWLPCFRQTATAVDPTGCFMRAVGTFALMLATILVPCKLLELEWASS